MMTHALSDLGKTPRADLVYKSPLYRSRPEDGISEIASDLTTGFWVIMRERKPFTGLALLEDFDVEDRVVEEVAGLSESEN